MNTIKQPKDQSTSWEKEFIKLLFSLHCSKCIDNIQAFISDFISGEEKTKE